MSTACAAACRKIGQIRRSDAEGVSGLPEPRGAGPGDCKGNHAHALAVAGGRSRWHPPARVHQVALGDTSLRPPQPWLIRWEIIAVFAVSLGASGLNALLNLVGTLLVPAPLSSQMTAPLVGSQASNHWLDLALQL